MTRFHVTYFRDRDGIFGDDFTRQEVKELGIEEGALGTAVALAQRAYVERVVGTILPRVPRSYMIVFGETSLRPDSLRSYFDYYHGSEERICR